MKNFSVQDVTQERLHPMTLECNQLSEDEQVASDSLDICHL